MELRHLRFVVTLAEELHFGKAAARLNISQPPLSRQIRQLEEELGVNLFRRTRRRVEVTEAGNAFVFRARQILADTKQAELAAKASLDRSKLSIGFVSTTGGIGILPGVLQAFHEQYPTVQVALRDLSSADQIRALRAGNIQIGFLSSPVNDPAIAVEVILREPLVLALSAKNPLSRRRQVPLTALAGESLIFLRRDVYPDYYDLISEACRTVRLPFDVAIEVDDMSTALILVAAGAGVSLVSASAKDIPVRNVMFRELQALLPWTELIIAYRRDASKVLSPLLEVIRRIVANDSGSSR
jgi:DNA-binding transcriptional LysR family regulator